jgi:alkylation response protein AidB-like acyl-CoA dehydrogenase
MAITDAEVRSTVELARELAPLIRASADETDRERALPRALFETLYDAGFWRMLMPRSLGGRELDLPTYVKTIEELGKADASTAWAINQGTVWATYSARMPHEVARRIWIETPRAVVSNTPAPTSTATVVDGGFRVSGKGGFSTGSPHASWYAANGRVVENGQVRLLPSGAPETRYLLVPAAEGKLLDTWKVRGMRGTGTHHFEVKDVFVPTERSVLVGDPPFYEPGPLYRIPRTLQFASGDAAVALGTARAALDTFVELAGGKTPRSMPDLLKNQSAVQSEVGQALADLESARALLYQAVGEVWQGVCANGEPTLDQRAALRLATTHGIRQGAKVVDRLYNLAGATAIYESHLLHRQFQDVHVMTQHTQGRPAHYELVGRHALGLEIEQTRL